MATLLIDGEFQPVKVLGGNYGLKKNDKFPDDPGLANVTINVEFIDGSPNKGRKWSFDEKVDAKSAPYIRKALIAVGWKGASLTTVKADVDEWIAKTGGITTADVQLRTRRSDNTQFTKVNAIGRKAPVLHAATDTAGQERLSDADQAMRFAAEADGGDGDEIPF